MEGMADEDRITFEIEELQSRLGDLQDGIDKVLQEVTKMFFPPFRGLQQFTLSQSL
jgi:hypothetical protein